MPTLQEKSRDGMDGAFPELYFSVTHDERSARNNKTKKTFLVHELYLLWIPTVVYFCVTRSGATSVPQNTLENLILKSCHTKHFDS